MILGYSCCRRIGSERSQSNSLVLGYASLRRCGVSWRNSINTRLGTNRALDADEGVEVTVSVEVREAGRVDDIHGRYDNGKKISEASKERVEKVGGKKDGENDNGDSSLSVAVPMKRRRGRPRKSEVQASQDKDEPTELIFKLDRRGYGWGEEIIPFLTVENRPVKRKPAGGKKTVELTVADDDEVSSEVCFVVGCGYHLSFAWYLAQRASIRPHTIMCLVIIRAGISLGCLPQRDWCTGE